MLETGIGPTRDLPARPLFRRSWNRSGRNEDIAEFDVIDPKRKWRTCLLEPRRGRKVSTGW